MKLEEAIKKLEIRLKPKLFGGLCTLGYDKKYCFGKEDLQAIETVLQALDNSISKDKVKEELNNIEYMIDKTTRGEIQKYTVGELILIRTIYNKLLEDK